MSTLLDIQQPGDIVWTMSGMGIMKPFKVQPDGTLVEISVEAALAEGF